MSAQPKSVSNTLPVHIAVIMDGNGRWALSRKLPRNAGHKKGADAVKRVIKACIELGIPYLTIYAFSAENWNRPAEEVTELMDLLHFYLGRELKELHEHHVRVKVVGDRARLSPGIRNDIERAEELTKGNTALCLTVALSYGSRQEIVVAARKVAEKVAAGELSPEAIDERAFSQYLYTHGLPDPDLLIRTSGEQRLSNFLLWQSAYTELYFTDVLWPDFGAEDLKTAVKAFQKRERRYGTA